MIIVLDASAAVEIAMHREYSRSFQEILRTADLVIAPDIFPSEITNVFWKYASYAGMPIDQCEKGIAYCIDLIDDYIQTKSMCREVFSESIRSNHAAYDLFYLVIARRNNAVMLTRDRKIRDTAEALKIRIAPENL